MPISAGYVDKDYVYAVSRIRCAEGSLLNAQAIDQLLNASDFHEAFKLLKDRGFGKEGSYTAEDLLRDERAKLWDFIEEIVPDTSVFNIFRLPNDYNNLKAAIKGVDSEIESPDIYISECTIDPKVLKEAVSDRDFDDLPAKMGEALDKALTEFLKNHDGQICDIICDRACLEDILEKADKSGDDFLKSYAETYVSSINIRIAVRASLTNKTRDFMEMAISDCESFDKEALIDAASRGGIEGIESFLKTTSYADAIDELKVSPAAFERWCDDMVTENSRKELLEFFGIGPIAAYILAKENEIKSVRILLSGKLNGFDESMIRERMRAPYV